MLLTEREVREMAGSDVDSDDFPRPMVHGPEGRKWDQETVESWMYTKKGLKKKTVRRPKGEDDEVETRPVE